jgi:hypothetical protein
VRKRNLSGKSKKSKTEGEKPKTKDSSSSRSSTPTDIPVYTRQKVAGKNLGRVTDNVNRIMADLTHKHRKIKG